MANPGFPGDSPMRIELGANPWIETIPILEGAVIKFVEVRQEDEVEGPQKDEYCAYQVIIVTDKGTVVVDGNHDGGPDISVNPGWLTIRPGLAGQQRRK